MCSFGYPSIYSIMTTDTTPQKKNMEVINRPQIRQTKKSLQFLLKDKRKVISGIIVLLLPVLGNVWRLVPEDIAFPYYETLDVFVWNFFFHLIIVAVGIAWLLSIQQKDHALQFISYASIAYGVLLTFETLPFTEDTPLWVDVIASSVIFFFIFLCLRYIQRYYLEPADYKTLHDGLVHDIHHQRFLGSIDRIEGLISIADMEEPYQRMCAEEIRELKKSIAYIADKYESLR